MTHSNIPMRESAKPHESHEHWTGTKNKLIRYYFYCNKGLDTFNQFRYVIMAVFGIYYTLHLHAPILLLVMLAVSIPILTIIGYYCVHHINKVTDYLNTQFGTYYGIMQIDLLKEIRDAIKSNRPTHHL